MFSLKLKLSSNLSSAKNKLAAFALRLLPYHPLRYFSTKYAEFSPYLG